MSRVWSDSAFQSQWYGHSTQAEDQAALESNIGVIVFSTQILIRGQGLAGLVSLGSDVHSKPQ